MKSLEAFCAEISAAKIPGKAWVDGSFLTEKIEPADVDVAIQINGGVLTTPSALQTDLILRIARKKFADCDSYVFFEYPAHFYAHADGERFRIYWERQFGLNRTKNTPKGIAVVQL
jgi:Family of unknown function (DUF6932)